jgi:hypothetical protein
MNSDGGWSIVLGKFWGIGECTEYLDGFVNIFMLQSLASSYLYHYMTYIMKDDPALSQ